MNKEVEPSGIIRYGENGKIISRYSEKVPEPFLAPVIPIDVLRPLDNDAFDHSSDDYNKNRRVKLFDRIDEFSTKTKIAIGIGITALAVFWSTYDQALDRDKPYNFDIPAVTAPDTSIER